ncbi:single-stranded DNA-binding protein [Arthrobacter sp.]|uniref:single-stranded DNA-binding protein n=1 Tax=Arthrobacter sp. TaxID=1667 RepID=UPI0028121923|nr:single-stranded DNA-binding protein [Arthrobacter sp.]
MTDNITVRGFVATEIKTSTTPGGTATASFRIGSTDRRFDRATSAWVDGNTNWFTVQGYRQLAGNLACSIKKGQRVIVVGRLKMRSWEKEGRIYHVAEIDAESVGHDLMWGSANFIRTSGQNGQSSNQTVQIAPEGDSERASREFAAEPDYDGPEREPGDTSEVPTGMDEPPSVFVDEESGELLVVDSSTGELTGVAA